VPAKIPRGIEAAVTIRCHTRKGQNLVTYFLKVFKKGVNPI